MILLTVRSGFFASTVAEVAAVEAAPVEAAPVEVVGAPPDGVLEVGRVVVVTCVGRPADGGPTRRVAPDPREPVAPPDPDRRCGPGWPGRRSSIRPAPGRWAAPVRGRSGGPACGGTGRPFWPGPACGYRGGCEWGCWAMTPFHITRGLPGFLTRYERGRSWERTRRSRGVRVLTRPWRDRPP